MKKLLALTLISISLFGCSNQQATQALAPVQQQANISSTSNWGNLIDDKTNGLNKERTLKQVSNNSITVKADDINKDKNSLLIYFSKGELMPNSHFHLVMNVKINDDQFSKRGDSWIGVESSYFSGFSLTKSEAAKLLKSATNYSKYSDKLDKAFK